MMKNRFLKKISIYFIGTLSSNMINVLLVPVYAYFVLTEDLGEYDYVLSIANMVTPFVFLTIWESILKYCINKTDQDTSKILSTSMAFAAFTSVICGIVFLVLAFLGIDSQLLFITLSFVVVQGFTTIWQYSARSLGESKQYVMAGVVGSVVVIACDLMFILFYKLDYVGLAISHVLSQVAILIVLELKIKLLNKFKKSLINKEILKKMLVFSVPLVLNNVCLWFYSGGNKVIVRNFIGTTENGLYSFASKFSILVNLCSTVISMAVIEEAYSFKTLEEYKIKIGKLITIISKAYFSMITLALPAIYILYSIAFKKTDYYNSSDYVFLLLLSALFTALSNNYGSSFQVTGNTKYISLTTIAGAISSLVISLMLVKSLNVWGVLLGAVIGPLVMMITRAIYAKKATGLSVNWSQNLIILGIAILSSIFLMMFDNILVQIAIFIAIIIVLLFSYREEIKILLRKRVR